MFFSVAYAQVADSTAAAHEGGGFPPFDSSFFGSHLFWLALCFGVFYWVMARVIAPRIGTIIETRQGQISADLERAAQMKQETDVAIQAYEDALSQARQSAVVIAQKANDEAKTKAEQERKKAEVALEKKLSAAEDRIYKIRDEALRDVGFIAEETAGEIVSHLIGGGLDKAAIARAVAQVKQTQ